MIVLTHKNRVKVEKQLKKANRYCGLGLFGLGIFGVIMSNTDKIDAFAEKVNTDFEDIRKTEDFDERVKKEREWLLYEGTPILALIGLPIASILAILHANGLHNKTFDICKTDLYDSPSVVRDALDYNFPDKI